MTKLNNEIRELSADELEAVSGGRIALGPLAFPLSRVYAHNPTTGGTGVGGGDTIDTDMEVNSNLPGKGPWGN